ncbi:hypothetical protein NDU88_011735 [Pleurodeles waltl]|uniref:Uncharacterized protein n=1 Tax=Pleurodeles waltl TaxID=8319 RepID=A0AAV7S733_PLEWA|nr:hypothetical protein NDU88_011735 [Pleurodeles waltl]
MFPYGLHCLPDADQKHGHVKRSPALGDPADLVDVAGSRGAGVLASRRSCRLEPGSLSVEPPVILRRSRHPRCIHAPVTATRVLRSIKPLKRRISRMRSANERRKRTPGTQRLVQELSCQGSWEIKNFFGLGFC